MYRPHGRGFILGYDGESGATSYLVRYTPGYDSGKIHDKIPLSACNRRNYSNSYFRMIVARSKLRN